VDVKRLYWSLGLLIWVLVGSLRAEILTFSLLNGESVVGEPIFNSKTIDSGVQIKIDEGNYQTISWTKFSQQDLKKLVEIPKIGTYAEPFIDRPAPVKAKATRPAPNLASPPHLEQPAPQSLVGTLFSSGVTLFVLLALYGANIFAAYEVAIFKARPPAVVAGLAAIPFLGFLATVVFLAMPSLMAVSAPIDHTHAAPGEPHPEMPIPVPAADDSVNPMRSDQAAHPASLHLAHSEADTDVVSALPQTAVFQRGQYTFNRRFFETKFAGFFGVVRRDADRDMILVIKTMRGEHTAQRISRIAANDLHLQVQHGAASQEVLVTFAEIQEIRLKHKNAH
jgi:hypothetical protein